MAGTAAAPTIMQYLKGQYDKHLSAVTTDLRRQLEDKGVQGFVMFCDNFFARNPAATTFYPGLGIGVQLANHDRFVLAGGPQASAQAARGGAAQERPGSMQESHAVEITKGEGIGEGTLPGGSVGL